MENEITKAQYKFEKWFINRFALQQEFDSKEWFDLVDFSMQWGVYLEFFDSVGIEILITKYKSDFDFTIYSRLCGFYETPDRWSSRIEAQKAAIEKAFEMLEDSIKQ